jgi:hypoxanthine phosphoribosyltransferase
MMESMKLSQLISAEDLEKRVTAMGREISDKFRGKQILVIGVLNGSFMFYSDLVRAIDLDLYCDFMGASSYAGMKSSGECQLTLDCKSSLKGQHVLLVEDIVDTGLTMNFLKNHILQRAPASLTTATLMLKPDALKVKCPLDHVGFKISNDFVVGYGLDYQGYYRNLPYIAQVQNIN